MSGVTGTLPRRNELLVGKNQLGSGRIPPPELSPAPSTTPAMQQIPPPEMPVPTPDSPDRPAVIPRLPGRRQAPGSRVPLPDLVAVRRLEIPDSAPPYDGEEDAAATRLPAAEQAASGDEPAAAADEGTAEPDPGSGQPRRPAGRGGPGRPGGSAQPGAWPSQFAQVLAETLAGSRSAQQLTPWTTEETRQRIRQLGPMLATGQRPRVRRIMTSAPARGVLELTAVVGFGSRVRVLAMRLERSSQPPEQWRCTALESA
jgi:hypothetical protein